jgi:hypothetical protein
MTNTEPEFEVGKTMNVPFSHRRVAKVTRQMAQNTALEDLLRSSNPLQSHPRSALCHDAYGMAYKVHHLNLTRSGGRRSYNDRKGGAPRCTIQLYGCMIRLNVHLGPGAPGSSSAAMPPGTSPDKGGWGVTLEGEWCRGLKMRTMINPKMISKSRNIQLLLPVFFWYLNIGESATQVS